MIGELAFPACHGWIPTGDCAQLFNNVLNEQSAQARFGLHLARRCIINIAKKSISETTITFAWADGSTSEIDTSLFSDEMDERARMHGYSQKLGDSYSGAKTVDEARERFTAVCDGIQDGDWNRKGVATGGLWVAAIAQAVGVTIEVALEKWQAMDEETRKTVCKHPDVVLARREIELARAKVKAAGSASLEI